MFSAHAALEVSLRGRSRVRDHVLRAMPPGLAEPSLTIYSIARNKGQVYLNCTHSVCTYTNKGTWIS